MHEHLTLLMRLGQIAGEPRSCEERASHALTVLNAYTIRLYARTGIGASNRLAMSAKLFADQTLADLRREILAADIRAAGSCRRVFTAVRHRIEMARRVLASRIADESLLSHRRLCERPEVAESNARERTIDLIPTDALGRTLRVAEERLHRPCRRARLGSLSGQLTM
jgi:hypothetical protein